MGKHRPAPDSKPRKAEDVLALFNALTLSEKKRLLEMLSHAGLPRETGYGILPAEMVDQLLTELVTRGQHGLDALKLAIKYANRLKRRKSSPEIILRNVEICDRRKQDPKKWSQGKLARTYHVTPRLIREVLKEEEKWRKLAAALGTN